MRRFSGLILAVCCGLSASSYANNLAGDQVVLRALDKVTATTKDFKVPVGESLKYGSLDIKVQHCEKKPPEEVPEVYAFLQIFEKQPKHDEPVKLFSGWMFASSPALSALEHPVYDIWVLDCVGNLREVGATDRE